jgi:dihydroflavonol-4-reductase
MMHDAGKILVTGGTGFVGSAVVRRLAQEPSCSLRVLVRPTGDRHLLDNLPGSPEVMIGDVRDKRSLLQALEGCSLVVNCAGRNSFWERTRRPYRELNVEAVQAVAEAALESGIDKMVHVSTAMAYGFPADSPFTENSAPGTHASEYARSKAQGDRIALRLCETAGLPLVIVYLAAVVGAGDRKPVMQIGRFVRGKVPLMIDSPYRFTYLHIEDAAEAIVRATLHPGNVGQRYLVGRDRLTTREYFEIIAAASGTPMPARRLGRRSALALARLMSIFATVSGTPPLMPYDLIATVYRGSLLFDGSKAERELGLRYTPVEDGLRDAVAEILGQAR